MFQKELVVLPETVIFFICQFSTILTDNWPIKLVRIADTYHTCLIASKKSNMKCNINDLLRPGRIVESVDYQKIVTKMEIECIEYLISSRACWLRITVVRPHFCFVQWVLGVFYMQKIMLVAFCVEILTQSPFLSVLVYTKTKLISIN